MIYLDHAATTPVPKAVADAMYTVLTEQYANPNAQYPFGQEMRRSVEDWRAVIAKAVGCEANQLFFTSCGTEGDNWAIRAACWQNRHVGRHIVTTAVEHHAVLDVRAVADDDPVHVAPQHGVVPDRAVAADGHVAQNDGRFGQKGVLSDHRLMPADFSYKRHI